MADLSNTKDITTVDSTPSVAITDKIYINKGGKLQQVSLATAIESKIDSSLSKIKFAADAKATKDAISKVDSDIKALNPISETIFSNTVTFSPTAYGNAIPEQIEGYIRQDTTKGLQLFDASKMNGYTTSGVHCKVSSDGTIRTKGTLTANYLTSRHPDIIDIKQGEKYSIKIFANKTMANVYVGLTPDDGSFDAQVNFTNTENSGTFTAKSNLVDFVVGANLNGLNMDGLEFKVMITKGEPANWEPYTGGQPAPNPDYPMVVQGVGYRGFIDDLYEFVYHGENDVVNKNNEWVASVNKIPCKSGDSVEIIYHRSNSNSMYGIIYYKGDDFVSILATQRGNRKFTVPSGVDGFRWQVYEYGDQPDPSFVDVKINGKYAVAVKSEGKNLFDLSKVEYGKAISSDTGNTFDALEDIATDYIRVDGSSYIYAKPMLAGQWMAFYSEIYDYISGWSGYGKIQVPSNAVYARFTVAKADMYEWYVIKGENALEEYLPYQSNTTYIPVDYPLFEGDKIVRSNGEYKLLRKWGFKTYDGSDDEDWKINYIAGSEAQNAVYNVYIGDMANDAKKERYVPCNYFFSPAMGYYLNTTYVSVTGNYNIIISPDMKIDTDQKWKDWLKTHIMYCAYELATPTEEPLSPEAVKALNSIMAADEETELTIVGVPSDAEIQNQFLLPRNEDGALNTTAYCTAKRNKIALEELVAQSLDARVNKLEVDNESLNLQTLIVE